MTATTKRAPERRLAPPAPIRFATAECALGRLLLATTPKGVCWLGFADTEAQAEAALRAAFPAADVAHNDAELAPHLAALQRHLAGEQPHLNLPLDADGTPFQRRVWAALRAIPYGETRTYKQVAEAVGVSAAVRAAARACATNPVAVIVPCHRVIGTDGKLHGYAYGLHRKKWLLEAERR